MSKLSTRFLAIALATLFVAMPVFANEKPMAPSPTPGPRLVKPMPKEADKVHMVLLVFGHSGGISAACQKDCKAMKAALEAAFEDEEDRLAVHELNLKNPKTNKPYNAQETMAAIKA